MRRNYNGPELETGLEHARAPNDLAPVGIFRANGRKLPVVREPFRGLVLFQAFGALGEQVPKISAWKATPYCVMDNSEIGVVSESSLWIVNECNCHLKPCLK